MAITTEHGVGYQNKVQPVGGAAANTFIDPLVEVVTVLFRPSPGPSAYIDYA